jgi:hypothetical protein
MVILIVTSFLEGLKKDTEGLVALLKRENYEEPYHFSSYKAALLDSVGRLK